MLDSQKNIRKFLMELIGIVIVAFTLSWFLRTYVVEAGVVPTGSMLPTIQLEDEVLVDKYYYKFFDQIHRQDIVVFRPPASAHATDDFIKRVIGLPGDTVEIRNGKTFINGKALNEPYILAPPKMNFWPIVVPKNSLFVMGDNRNNSDDSRLWGFLPIPKVIGRAFWRYWPLNRFGPLTYGYIKA